MADGDGPEEELRRYLARAIPLAGAMELRVLSADPDRIILEAPLEPNLNHRSTAFGGSVAALATLAGWSVVHGRLEREGRHAQTVIQRSRVEYLAPVTGPFRAVCRGPDTDAWSRLIRALERAGRGRVHLEVDVESGGDVAARFQGDFVALSPRDPPPTG